MQARRVRRLAAGTAIVLAATATALAGAGVPAYGAGGEQTTFTVRIKQDIDSLNPFTGIVSSAYEMYQMNYDTLTDYGAKDFSAQPALAESWDTSADGLTWTYHLRPNLKWSDGQPLTSADVA